MYNLFRLIRIYNLLLIAITQYLVRFCIVKPILSVYGLQLGMSEFWFAMLVLSTVLIAAGGYAINDYFDTKTDRINRPDRVLVGKTFSRGFAIKLHFGLSTIGSLMGIATAIYVGEWKYALIFPLVAGMLWFYSTTYKSQFLIGNFIVSFLAAMVPVLVLIFEVARIGKIDYAYIANNQISLSPIIFMVLAYGLFAFLTTLIREVVKDMEDFKGDIETGRSTLPIVWGLTRSKIVVATLAAIEIGATYVAFFAYLYNLPGGHFDWISLTYITITIALPLFVAGMVAVLAKTSEGYRRSSLLVKIAMFGGVLYMVVFYEVFAHAIGL